VYVVAVNDVFVLKWVSPCHGRPFLYTALHCRAWKNQLAPDGTKVRFIADDKAELTLALGMLFDATPLLGGPRSKVCFTIPHRLEHAIDRFWRKRHVVITEGDKITSVAVEPNPGEVTITAADKILPLL